MSHDKNSLNGISIIYTPYSECRGFKNWALVSREKIREAKVILRERIFYRVSDPLISNQERYLESGILIELQEESKPTMKDGWSIRLQCEIDNAENLEDLLKLIDLPNLKKN
ncbi:MAG: hypothetical protein ABIH65_01945 [Nanoarchaeota archaeon]